MNNNVEINDFIGFLKSKAMSYEYLLKKNRKKRLSILKEY